MKLPFQVDLNHKVAVVTGGSGVLGSVLSRTLAQCGAKVAVLARNQKKIDEVVSSINETGGTARGYSVDVLDPDSLQGVKKSINEEWGKVDILINGAGGNHPKATTSSEYFTGGAEESQSFFELSPQAVDDLFRLNFSGTLVPTQVFAKDMPGNDGSTIINVSSMNAFTPLTKIPAYSGAKAAVSNFTQWLAVHFSKVGIRVNAIAPGFFLTEQNRNLLLNEEGDYTERADKILTQTPMDRFGEAGELAGTILWLVDSKASSFVNGIVVPVDGGFSAYSGV
ncbi:SDR family NAD(P)-dependent oxidoreductase [Halobacillus litoralis]|uniref:SDR family NAD(P)-dependent oxidoreductase n=1 Tax=Halobacillus litoralis TaxID=45668 RepID=A0A845E516_9BACI|nr:SDR family oxidoreductase [Halobacillus litoralis]MYL49276.1 SDR family NAD(P)-dependent oxidoreductase [Halobacillus litoralis]